MDPAKKFDIPIAKPYLAGGELELVAEVLESGWLIQGPMVAKFEESVKNYIGTEHAVAYSSCTSALHIALVINGLGADCDVLCPSYSFVATANSIRHAGAEPVFVDIDKDTLNITAHNIERTIAERYDSKLKNKETGRTLKGIMVVHQIGVPADIDAINEVAKKHKLIVVEDAACALGSTYKGAQIGSSQNISALSFHPRKVITTGEGGMILTRSKDLAELSRVYREHGASISPLVRHSAQPTVYENYSVVGYNYRMTDMQGAVGIKQMEILDNLIERRVAAGKRFNDAFAKLPEISTVTLPTYVTKWNFQSYPIRLNEGGSKRRDQVMAYLKDRGITTRRGIPPIHLEPPYHNNYSLPVTEEVSDNSLFLPIFPQMRDEEIEHVISSVKESLRTQVLA